MKLLRLDDAPRDALERILWLSNVMAAVQDELEQEYAVAYFDARLQGRFEAALRLGVHGKKRALAMTRRVNNARQRMVRWNDGLDWR